MIVVRNLVKCYRDQTILNNISFNIAPGEMVAIIGSSGSGKSTLLRAINHLEAPDGGEVLINGKGFTKKNLNKMRRQVGMVFQQFNLFPHFTTLENVTYGPTKLLKKSPIQAIKLANNLLRTVNMLGKSSLYPYQLSGGQKQRVAIARTMAMSPKCILFDEPTSALDPENIGEVIDTIEQVAAKGIACIIVTHSMRLAQKCNRVIFLDHGKILEDTKSNQFFKKPKSDRAREFLAMIND
ncbi:MAG: amino acid ABC transporter ATP-binding protein [Pseudomonadota bacterium]